ncbi:putative NBD/HSP70 family sugar kinase [Nocardioides ginsengisegetis]|uniref:Putative NBD/HSP70 family sugar kinase n=1 Tax=Nocardioides ginsengisegetis TaxID=661491 RepID=A0A7W3IWZ0_9ACTN|nr:ROK family transcriptional regulator [Nocardioides ginsengisegetis]MBA8802175.1 putative NBD/HSP70 family sugar kinase [Nocardioides ginsengisegetis]
MRHHRTDAAPGSTSTLRTANQQRVLDVLRSGSAPGPTADLTGGDFTQAELARVTGLAPATVSNIVRELVASGLVETEAGSGRRGSAIRLARAAGIVGGVDFGHSHVAVAIGDLTGRLLAEERQPLEQGHAHIEALRLASSMLDAMTSKFDPAGPIRHIGLGLPAPVTNDVVRSSAIFPGWDGVNTRAAAEEHFGIPVHVENDANLGALAEHRQGVARGHDSSVFVKISSGVGAGIIIHNELFHGSGGTAGEIGHLTLDDAGPLCRCGSRGCLEAYASTGTVLAMMAGQLPDATLDDLLDAARTGNVSAQRALEDAGLHLGKGIASVVNLINPSVVVIGGDMARAGDLLLESARIGLRRHALDSVALTPILASELGERASLVGAVLLAAERTVLVVEHA